MIVYTAIQQANLVIGFINGFLSNLFQIYTQHNPAKDTAIKLVNTKEKKKKRLRKGKIRNLASLTVDRWITNNVNFKQNTKSNNTEQNQKVVVKILKRLSQLKI